MRRDEREREVSRALMELKLKEEFYDKEHKRKTEQLKELEQRLKVCGRVELKLSKYFRFRIRLQNLIDKKEFFCFKLVFLV